ncbi:hypothetical protein NFIA_096010 [Paecilomyces variotii No. 5]|uniref:Uncharacterized protein n=1 Tax=Byssochlamys spectabilis (strain No. 5 / NBRC 109023) TaxID=1356009 RepID=V5G3W5_BYSSN|nr:hypothetical protein NFIA_096010 [Paecilomyces variotii No. 5]
MSDSPRILRSHLGSDKTRGPMSLERYLYLSDPYRSTTVLNPLPYSLSKKPVTGKPAEDISRFYQPIATLLDSYGFFHDQYSIGVFEVTKPGYPDGERPINILQVKYWVDALIPCDLANAPDRICGLLAEEGINIDIEIVNSYDCIYPQLFAIMPDHPTVGPFEQAREQLIDILNGKLPERWHSLCLFKVDFFPGEASSDLTSVARSMQPGKDNESMPPVPQLHNMDGIGRLQRGMSISPKGQDSVGNTMGGFVTITREGITHKGFLTTYDAVRPSLPTVTETDRKVISIDHPNCLNIEVIYPAPRDTKATKEEAQKVLEDTKTSLDELTERKKNYELVGKLLKIKELGYLKYVEKEYKYNLTALQAVQGMPTKIGKVTFASGLGFNETALLNWAFVEITEPDALKFFRRDWMLDVPYNQRPYNQHPYIDGPKPVKFDYPRQRLTGIGELEKGEYYVMVSRSSVIQVGICNGIKASCVWRKNDIRYDKNGNAVDAAKITDEYVVVGERSIAGKTRSVPFCCPGDSGAFLINTKAEVCGLLYGYINSHWPEPDWFVNVGLATCMADIRMSIQALATPHDAQGNPAEVPAELDLP